MGFTKGLRNFLRRQSYNFKVLIVKRGLESFFSGFTSNYTSVYVTKLGADPVQLGGLNSLGGIASAILALPMGWLLDTYSLKKTYLLTLILSILLPLTYAVSMDWRMALIPVALGYITMSSSMVVENVILANSLRDEDRATGIGLIQALTGVAMSLSPTLAGLVLNMLGGLEVEYMRVLFLIQLIGSCLAFAWILFRFKEPMNVVRRSVKLNFIEDLKEVLASSRSKKWLLVELSGGFIFGMVIPFIYVYAAEVKHADALTLGLMGSGMNFTYMASSIPIGKLADRIGRKKTIMLLRPTLYLSMILLVVAPSPEYLILAMALRGFTWGGMAAWSSLALELVSESERGRWSGVIQLLRNLFRVPAPLVGGYLWAALDPSAPFLILVLVDILFRVPLIASTPETLEARNSR